MSAAQVTDWIRNDPLRWALLGHVRDLGLPDCWIAAGFVRNAIWSILHGQPGKISGDIDVIWFDSSDPNEERDRAIEVCLHNAVPGPDWSVNNQALMHIGNCDEPYVSSNDAMRFWPETATAVAVRRTDDDICELLAPLGIDDLLALKLRPAGAFADRKRAVFDCRVREKRWLQEFPKLVLIG